MWMSKWGMSVNHDDVIRSDAEAASGTVLGGARPEAATVRRLVAERVLATPGVTRLEPSLQQSISRIAGASWRRAGALMGRRTEPKPMEDGVHVTANGATVTVTIDVVMSADATMVHLGDEIRSDVRRLLLAAGFEKVRVDVAVLGVDD